MTRSTWSKEENNKFMAAYDEATKSGLDDKEKFAFVSSKLKDRNPLVCNNHWLNALDPARSTGAWTLAEDKLLAECVERLGTSWMEVAKEFIGRTANMCKNRFYAEARKLDRSKSRIKSEKTTSKPSKKKIPASNPSQSNTSEMLSSSSFSTSVSASENLSSSSTSSATSSSFPFSILLSTSGSTTTLTTDQTLARFAFSTPSSSSATAISSAIVTPPEEGSDNESLGDTAWLTCI
jgi:hypothetical protein